MKNVSGLNGLKFYQKEVDTHEKDSLSLQFRHVNKFIGY